MKKLLLIAALLLAPVLAQAQTTPCAAPPAAGYVKLTDTTYNMTQSVAVSKTGVCRGTATYLLTSANLLRYLTQWAPCADGQWRLGSLFSTLSGALNSANKPPVCPVVPPPFDGMLSATASTLGVSPDSLVIGGVATVTVKPKNAAGAALGAGKVVVVSASGGSAVVSLTVPAYTVADSTYRVTATAVGSGTPLTISATVDGTSLASTAPLRIPIVVVTPPPPVTTGVWQNVTPANANITTNLACGNYGVNSVQVDPQIASAVYAFFDCQGVWKSLDYGATWTGPISPAGVNDCAGGIRIGGDGTIHLACIRGAAIGYWNSKDKGVTWTRYGVAPAPISRQDFYVPVVDPYDAQHVLMSGHEQDVIVESVNGGATWATVPHPAGMLPSNGSNTINFVNMGNATATRGTFLVLSQQSDVYGTFRTADGGTSWLKVDKNEHLHGNGDTYQPDASGVVYMAGVYSLQGWGVLRSADYGVTWAHVNGANGSHRVVIGTGKTLFGSTGYPGGIGSSFGPNLVMASQPGTGVWVDVAAPAGMVQGANAAAVTSDGTKSYVITANLTAGLWRYVEDGATALPLAPAPAPAPVTPPAAPAPAPTPTPAPTATSAVVLDSGVNVVMLRPSTTAPAMIGYEGNFRTLCFAAKTARMDPIVYPGQANVGHEHLFFGNTGITENSTPASLVASGNSTCWGGISNRTGYWVPTLRDSATKELQIPSQVNVYYKSAYLDAATIQVIPAGLKMIAGDKNRTTPDMFISWNCSRTWNQQATVDGLIPNCPVGEDVILSVGFPECWNGKDLDSPDHMSHMSHMIFRNPGPSVCPSTHPVPLPKITENFIFPVRSTSQPLRWRLSSDMYATTTRGGLSAHADWMNGWDQVVLAAFTKSCINATRDCTAQLGDGRDLYYKP